MDHAAAHERIEDLMLEPARLAALEFSTESGDVALREHLAGCASCAADLASWRRLHMAIDSALPAGATPATLAAAVEPIEPPPSLWIGILASVADAARAAASEIAPPGSRAESGAPVRIDARRSERMRRRSRLGSLIGLAAGIALLAGSGYVAVDQVQQRAAAEANAASLQVALEAVDRMLATDHKIVALRDTSGGTAGTISWSRHDWVVLTTGLQEPPAGSTYRCWLVENGSQSMAVGQMEFSGGVAFWATSVDRWQTWEIGPTTQFIVSLEAGAPAAPSGDIVLSAVLGS
jgi:hypothetical protein